MSTNFAGEANSQNSATRKRWSAPSVRSVVPVRRTQGGGGNRNDQDDGFYDIS